MCDVSQTADWLLIYNIHRYEIPTNNKGKEVINRPYTFVFDRLQVVGDEMVGWAGAESSSKKYAYEVDPSNKKVSRRHSAGDEDIEL